MTQSDSQLPINQWPILAGTLPLMLDGGLATELERQGHNISTRLWSAALLDTNPEAIVQAHMAYFKAGADIAISASYQACREAFTGLGKSRTEADRLVGSSVGLARQAREQYREMGSHTRPLYLAASLGPWGAAQHDGSEYTGQYDISPSRLRDFHEQRLAVLDASGADVIACETIPNAMEAEILLDLLAQVNTPSWVSFCCRDGSSLSDGSPVKKVAELFENQPNVLAVGVNCSSPQYVSDLIGDIRKTAPGKAIVVYPNSGEDYDVENNTWLGTATPIECGSAAVSWRAAGASLIGGCCRMGPAHITAMRLALGLEWGIIDE